MRRALAHERPTGSTYYHALGEWFRELFRVVVLRVFQAVFRLLTPGTGANSRRIRVSHVTTTRVARRFVTPLRNERHWFEGLAPEIPTSPSRRPSQRARPPSIYAVITMHAPPTRHISLGTVLKMIGRALLLRCPRCGGGHLLRTWTKMKSECPTCGLHLEREESDFWLGGYLINFVVAELLVALLIIIVLLTTWSDVPWTALQYGGAGMVILAPFAFYPFSRLIWLAIDLAMRPTV